MDQGPGGLNRQPAPPARVGRKQRKKKGFEPELLLPTIAPLADCKLKFSQLEYIKEFLIIEQLLLVKQEYVFEEYREDIEDIRGSPMIVGSLKEMIDEKHAIVSSSLGPEYYVGIMSFVDKNQLEPGCEILMNEEVRVSLVDI